MTRAVVVSPETDEWYSRIERAAAAQGVNLSICRAATRSMAVGNACVGAEQLAKLLGIEEENR